MKTYFLFFTLIFFAFAFNSCNSDDDNQPIGSDNHPIVGEWSLISSKSSFGDPTIFNQGDIVWNFSGENEITITINIEVTTHVMSVIYPFHVSGTQDYQINNNQITFYLDYMPDGENDWIMPFEIDGDSLNLGNIQSPSDGGRLLTFIKN